MRSIWKGPTINKKILKLIFFEFKNKKKNIFNNILVNRNITILPQFINFTFKIYNGSDYSLVKVLPTMIGDKFGMYSLTRKKNLNRYKKWRKK